MVPVKVVVGCTGSVSVLKDDFTEPVDGLGKDVVTRPLISPSFNIGLSYYYYIK